MPQANPKELRSRLAGIQTFPQLVAFLRDDMGWPIEREDFEDLTFEYTPEELGIDAKNAAKIQEIRRLRPMATNQPWGIFFVKFEPKRLPVVALRRILGSVALKKRASANAAERTAWRLDDLLFLSSYGEGEERQISFAHFAAPKEEGDLPTLKVLGWDNLDTPLHLDAVAQALGQHLSWPAKADDREAWRQQWRSAFTLRHLEVVTTAKDLSIRLAGLARAIRDRIKTALAIETDKGSLTKLMKAFQTALVHDLDADGFADMYAQTIAYGLLSARIADPHRKTADDFAGNMRTNPFLRELMETFLKAGGRRGKAGGPGIDFDELGVSEVVELLDVANMEAVLRDFGNRNPQEDPVIHFYEHFLAAYDKKQKVSRGVFYTPRPVVSFIVRSVDELLRSEFGLADGLADTTTWGEMSKRNEDLNVPDGRPRDQAFVQILDPATGTGTFLVETIDLIHETMVEKWRVQGHGEEKVQALWNEYVPKQLLPRLHGYELLMAPYAIAHLKIGLKLLETGYRFESDERARVYLTNALEPAGSKQLTLDFLPALAHEAEAVSEIKRSQRFTVVVGNPPYSGLSSNMGPWIDGLLKGRLPDGAATASYYHVAGEPLGERKVWLQDDYVKFIRLSQWLLDQTGAGVHGYISNHGYLDNPTFRGMRWSLMQSFPRIRVLDLHGNLMKKEIPRGGGQDVNVFDIQQGVAIGLFTKSRGGNPPVRHADLWGERERKYGWLLDHSATGTEWTGLDPAPSFYLFQPFDETTAGSYYDWPPINEIIPVNVTGIVTARDEFVVDFDREALRSRIDDLRSTELTDAAIRQEYFAGKGSKKYPPGDSRGWKLPEARKKLRADKDWDKRYTPVFYRPFDIRELYYVPWMVDWPRTEAMPHLLAGENLGLIFMRQVAMGDEYSHFGVSRHVVDARAFYSNKGIMSFGPLYLYPSVGKVEGALFSRWPKGKGGRIPNLDFGFVERLAKAVGLRFVGDCPGDLQGTFGPEDVLAYIYAAFQSPGYRERYEAHLKRDFPRVPLPGNGALFSELVGCGRELLALHLLESSKLDRPITEYLGGRAPEVEKASWSKNTVWIDKAQTTGFKGVREEVWNFHIGGYQVCEKWLKDRKGRRLSKDDIAHYQKIVVALSETIRLMKEIDEVIEQHGGWPGAFQTGEKTVGVAVPGRVVPFRPRTAEPRPEERYVTCVPLLPLEIAAGAFGGAQASFEEAEVEWVEVGAGRRLRPGMFVAQVAGKSMEPEIPDGAYCLFRAPVEGSRQGRTVLVELRDAVDPETGERYTVKRYESEKAEVEGSWRHAAITLRPVNPAFQPIVLEAGDEERLRVVAELVEILRLAPEGEEEAQGKAAGPSPTEATPQRAMSGPPLEPEAPTKSPGAQLPLLPGAGATAGRGVSEVTSAEAICTIRDVFGSAEARDGLERESAIRAIARALGFARTGKKIRAVIDSHLTAAARRGLVETRSGGLHLVARAIGECDRGMLKDQFLSSLGGYAWTDREDAIRGFARWMGYARTGPEIDETARSLINGLLRENRLESQGNRIRRARAQ